MVLSGGEVNKAPILTDGELEKVYKERYLKACQFAEKYETVLSEKRNEGDRQRCFATTHREGIQRATAQAQLDSAHLHCMGVVREIFEQLEGDCPHCPPGYKYKADCLECLSELKSRFLEGEK